MGGQACILYGAAEFTRDVDLAVAVAPANLERLRRALADLEAEQRTLGGKVPRSAERGRDERHARRTLGPT
jgi:hypothetical protein